MKRAATGTTDTTDTPASKAVATLEAIPLGSDHLAALTAAREALDDERAAAVALVFPMIHATSTADAIAIYTHAVDAFSRPTMDRDLLQLHAEGLAALPAVAAVVRTKSTLTRLDAALTFRISDTEERAAVVAEFSRGIARQAAEAGDQSPAVITLATILPALEGRISAAVQRHDAHAEEQRQRETEARKTRALAARKAREAAVVDLRAWFASKATALFIYRDVPTLGARYAEQVLDGNPAQIPLWRVRHAIAARKSHEPNFRCSAWQREWASDAERQAYDAEIKDLRQRLQKISAPAFSYGNYPDNFTGAQLAAALLKYESDGSGVGFVPPSNVRRCIAAVQRFDKSYEWRGPNFSGFEVDEELEATFSSEDEARSHAEHLATTARDLAALSAHHAADNAKRIALEEKRNQ